MFIVDPVLFRIRTDNKSVMSALNKGYSKSEKMREILAKIIDLCVEHNIILQAEHIPGKLNIQADVISRRVDIFDWSIDWGVFRQISARWGPFQVDRMATARTAKVLPFNSLIWDVGCSAVETFSQNWGGVNNYVFPPFHLVDKVIRHFKNCGAFGVIVAPMWDAQPWWPALLSISKDYWVLPRVGNLFTHGVFGDFGLANSDFIVCCVDCRFILELVSE